MVSASTTMIRELHSDVCDIFYPYMKGIRAMGDHTQCSEKHTTNQWEASLQRLSTAQSHRILIDQDAKKDMEKFIFLWELSWKHLMRGKPCGPSIRQPRLKKSEEQKRWATRKRCSIPVQTTKLAMVSTDGKKMKHIEKCWPARDTQD